MELGKTYDPKAAEERWFQTWIDLGYFKADPQREGIRLCAELLQELATIPGIAGAHIMAPGNDAAIPEVIAAVRGRVR